MNKEPVFKLFGLLGLTGLLLCGCDRQSPGVDSEYSYFNTPWQDECQFIVTAIVTDIAEMAYYIKHNRLPDSGRRIVKITEEPGCAMGMPRYVIEVAMDRSAPLIREELDVRLPIWSPEIYSPLLDRIFDGLRLTGAGRIGSGAQGTDTLRRLLDLTATGVEEENQAVSKALEQRFDDANLHVTAAIVLGAFMLRENSGSFYDIRSPLCRLTAHLGMAGKLAGTNSIGLNRTIAEAMLYTLLNNQQAALEELAGLEHASTPVLEWVRALRARNTHDYRPLEQLPDPTLLERIEGFRASCNSRQVQIAWDNLSRSDRSTIPEFARIACASQSSVEVGHQLLGLQLPLELKESTAVQLLAKGRKLRTEEEFVRNLNATPERCFGGEGKGPVRVIGPGQWSAFSQRHVCHALQGNFDFMQRRWGVPDEAAAFSKQAESAFGGLRLYPFVRRYNCTEVADYHRSVDDGFAVTVATPHLVSSAAWLAICYPVDFAPLYEPNSAPHLNEWHRHNPPPGTAYDLAKRWNHRSLVGRSDFRVLIEKLHRLAPYDTDISFRLLWEKYQEKETYAQSEEVFRPVLDYDALRLAWTANKARHEPAKYEELMLRAAVIDPVYYYALGEYFQEREEETTAIAYLEKAMALHPDRVKAANEADTLIRYYEKNGMAEKATALADEAAETWSGAGLEAKAALLEGRGQYDEALDYYRRIAERYRMHSPLASFCARYKSRTGSSRYEMELESALRSLFPQGLQQVQINQLTESPEDGVSFSGENARMINHGIQKGDIVVALNGIRVHNFEQYNYVRDSGANSGLGLILWREDRYFEVDADPPNRRFGVYMSNYKRRGDGLQVP